MAGNFKIKLLKLTISDFTVNVFTLELSKSFKIRLYKGKTALLL